MKTWITGLIISSLVMPSTALGAPDSDMQRAFKASKLDDYGFLDVQVGCDMYSAKMLQQMENESVSFFVPDKYGAKFKNALDNYIYSILKIPDNSDELAGVFKRPLAVKIFHYLLQVWNEASDKSEKEIIAATDVIGGICVPAHQALIREASPKAQIQVVDLSLKSGGSEDSHDQCLDARDYEGCIRVKSGIGSIKEPSCDDEGFCQANGEVDRYGNLPPKGWWCESSPSIYNCFSRVWDRVPHKGQSSRYVATRAIQYKYLNPTAGTAARTNQIGSSQTNCYGYGSSINCTTTPPLTITTPGTPGRAGGWHKFLLNVVYDCKDKTQATYWNQKPKGDWKKISDKKADKVCSTAADLPVRNMKL